jgi:hypothetical protein
MPDKITLKPYGGLANRMRAIDSAYILAEYFDIKLRINWEMSFELNCPVDMLFRLPERIELREYYVIGLAKRSMENLQRTLAKFHVFLPPGHEIYLFDKQIEDHRNNNTDFKKLLDIPGSVYIKTVHRFYKSDSSFKIFKPIPVLQQKIDFVTGSFPQNTIGIHIRRTDNYNSIRYSPLDDFISIMHDELKNDTDTKFFLATDSAEVEEKLKQTYEGRIITYPKVCQEIRKKEFRMHS